MLFGVGARGPIFPWSGKGSIFATWHSGGGAHHPERASIPLRKNLFIVVYMTARSPYPKDVGHLPWQEDYRLF